MTLRVAFVGSREYPHENRARSTMREIYQAGQISLVVSGGARGPDTWAVDEATKAGLPVLVLHADWTRHGKTAGFLRNTDIVEASDAVVAFWDLISRGTADTLRKARAGNKRVIVFDHLERLWADAALDGLL